MTTIVTGIVAVVLLIAVDVWLVASGRETWSEVLYDAALRTPAPAYLVGFLAGHWFPVPGGPVIDELHGWIFVAVWALVILTVVHMAWQYPAWIALVAGIAAGSLLWPVRGL